MQIRSYTLRFLTPAFLGNAEQVGQWRTPPIKALLRQFWRVAYAAERNFNVDVAAMRHEEGVLFGHAWLEKDKDSKGRKAAARQSAIRTRLRAPGAQPAWAEGSQQGVQPLSTGLNTSYAWFGLVKRGRGEPDRRGIKAEGGPGESTRQLTLAFPTDIQQPMETVIDLVHAFGLLGSRSRGGWGALHVEGARALDGSAYRTYARDLGDCLESDWAMSLAQDDQGTFVWETTKTFQTWPDVMQFVATHRRAVRTSLKQSKDLRPALGFALRDGRMPSPLRWKVFADQPGQLKVRIFAMPHRLPEASGIQLSTSDLHLAWATVLSTLRDVRELQRVS